MRVYDFIGASVVEPQAHSAGLASGRLVRHLGREFQHVSFAQEAWRIRLNHQVFGRYHLVLEKAAAQVAIVREPLELPFRQRLGHGELQFHHAVLVRYQVGEEECGFVQVLASRYLAQIRTLLLTAAFCLARPISHLAVGVCHCHGRSGSLTFHGHAVRHRGLRCRHAGGKRYRSTCTAETACIAAVGLESPEISRDVRGERTIRQVHRLVLLRPASLQMLEAFDAVLEPRVQIRMVRVEGVERLLPGVRQVSVQRRVIKARDHFGHGLLRIWTGDHCRPRLLVGRTQLRNKVFPLDCQVLVRPRDIHAVSREVGSVLAHHGDSHRESAAHLFGDRLLYLDLSAIGFRPVALDLLAPMFDFDERACLTVA